MAHIKVTYGGQTKDSRTDWNIPTGDTVTLETGGKFARTNIQIQPIVDPEDASQITFGNAVPGDVRQGKTALAGGVTITGTLPEHTPSDITFNPNVGVSSKTVTITAYIPEEGIYSPGPVTYDYDLGEIIPDFPFGSEAEDEHILFGYQAYDDDGNPIVGTMPNNGLLARTISNEDGTVTLPLGYISGGTVYATPGTIQSGVASVSSPVYDSDSGKFKQTVTVAPAIVSSTGYVSSVVGNKNGNTGTDAELNKIGIGVTLSSNTITYTPSIARQVVGGGVVDAFDSGSTVTITSPTVGVWVAVNSSSSSDFISASPTVTSEGYGTGSAYNPTSTTLVVDINSATTTFVPIKTTTMASVATATYTVPAVVTAGAEVTIVATMEQSANGWVSTGSNTENVINIPVYTGPFV